MSWTQGVCVKEALGQVSIASFEQNKKYEPKKNFQWMAYGGT